MQKLHKFKLRANILLDRLHNKNILIDGEEIDLVVDRKDTKKSLEENLINYLSSSMHERRGGEFQTNLHASHENKSLQAVDFISWAIFRKYEYGDYEFYELIKDKIVDEKLLFP